MDFRLTPGYAYAIRAAASDGAMDFLSLENTKEEVKWRLVR
jgi:hypothetical protein